MGIYEVFLAWITEAVLDLFASALSALNNFNLDNSI